MKRISIPAVSGLLCFISLSLQAQVRSFGVKGGVSFSNFWDAGVARVSGQLQNRFSPVDEQSLIWFTAGVFNAREWIPDFMSTQSELIYSRGGKRWEAGGQTLDLVIDYLRMPAILQIQLPLPFLTPSAYIGPQISWAFRALARDIPAAAGTEPFFEQLDIQGQRMERDVNIIDLGFETGLNFVIPAGFGAAVVDLRYQMGFLNAFNFAQGNDIRNYALQVMVGYALQFGAGPRF